MRLEPPCLPSSFNCRSTCECVCPAEAVVRVRGFEPPRPFGHRDLNPARLPSFATPAYRWAIPAEKVW
jgi:hypothetical protein